MAVRERAVRLGPLGLFGIETEPAVIAGSGPTCVFFSVANEHRIGPGRLWVGLSRSLAGADLRSVRVDVNGFGDSPSLDDGQGLPPVHSVIAIDDVLESARAISPDDPGNVVLFGLCSSGYQILEAALSLSPQGVCPLNPALVFEPPEMASRGRMDRAAPVLLARERARERSQRETAHPVGQTAVSQASLERAPRPAHRWLASAQRRRSSPEPPWRADSRAGGVGHRRPFDLRPQ